MSKTLQLKRGNTAENNAYTGAVAEVTVDTQAKALRLHDGSTAGGVTIAAGGEANVIESIKLNGTAQTVTNKAVDLSVQTPINADNKISAAFVDDSSTANKKFVTTTEKTNWNNKQEAISDLSTIRTNASEALKQKTTLPTAALAELGKIYQYIGDTNANYEHGYVYQCDEIYTADSVALSGTFPSASTTIQKDVFVAYVQPTTDTVITLTWDDSADSWKVGNELVDYRDYGIRYGGIPVDGDTIIITYTAPAQTDPRTFKWNRLDLQPDGVKSAIFVATYGVTTYDEVSNALAEGKICYCKYGSGINYYYYAGIDNNAHHFVRDFRGTHNMVSVSYYDDEWLYEQVNIGGGSANALLTTAGAQSVVSDSSNGWKTYRNGIQISDSDTSYTTRNVQLYTQDGFFNIFNQAAGSGIRLRNGGFTPYSSSYNLGTTDYKWKDLYMKGKIYSGATNPAELTLPSTSGTLALTSDTGAFEDISVDEPLVKNSFTKQFINDLGTTTSSGEIVSFDKGDAYISPNYFHPTMYYGTYENTTLNIPKAFPGSLMIPANEHTLVCLDYTSDASAGYFYQIAWGYYDTEGNFIPVLIKNGSLLLVLSGTPVWTQLESGYMGYTSGAKIENIVSKNITGTGAVFTEAGAAGDATRFWQFIVPADGNNLFKFYICEKDSNDVLKWYYATNEDLGISESVASKIDTCMLLGYFYNRGSIPTATNAVYQCTGTAEANKSSDVNRGDNILLTYSGSKDYKKIGMSINFWTGTEVQYNAITTKDPNTLYIITPAS